jgi:hypothetical protein
MDIILVYKYDLDTSVHHGLKTRNMCAYVVTIYKVGGSKKVLDQNTYKRNLMDLVGLLDNVRLERHPDLLIKAIVVHVDVDDGDILVAGFAA